MSFESFEWVYLKPPAFEILVVSRRAALDIFKLTTLGSLVVTLIISGISVSKRGLGDWQVSL